MVIYHCTSLSLSAGIMGIIWKKSCVKLGRKVPRFSPMSITHLADDHSGEKKRNPFCSINATEEIIGLARSLVGFGSETDLCRHPSPGASHRDTSDTETINAFRARPNAASRSNGKAFNTFDASRRIEPF